MHGSAEIPRIHYRVGLVLVAVLAVAVRWHLLSQPLDRDEGLYAYMAQRILAGDVPYRDVFSDKPPVGFLIYTAFLLLFGETTVGIHVGGAIWAAAAAVLLAELARRLTGPVTGLIAGLLFAISSAEGSLQGSSINLELLLTPFVILALLALVGPHVSNLRCLLAGALVGTALATKQQAVGHAAFAGVWLVVRWLADADRRVGRLLARQAMLALGAAAVLAITAAVFWAGGALEPYLDGVLRYNIDTYVPREPLERALGNLWRGSRALVAGNPLLHVAAVVGLWDSLRRRTHDRAFAPLWWVSNLVAVCIGLRFYRHYFLLTQPATILLAATAIGRVIEWSRAKTRAGAWGWAVIAAVALGIVSPLALQRHYFFTWSPGEHVRGLYGQELFAESEPIARQLAGNTSPDDTVFVYGSEPQIYFLAQRRCATRYPFVHPLTARGPRAIERQHEFLDQILRQPPACILTVGLVSSQLADPQADLAFVDRLTAFTREHYQWVLAIQLDDRGARYQHASPGQPYQPVPGDRPEAILLERRDRQKQ